MLFVASLIPRQKDPESNVAARADIAAEAAGTYRGGSVYDLETRRVRECGHLDPFGGVSSYRRPDGQAEEGSKGAERDRVGDSRVKIILGIKREEQSANMAFSSADTGS